MPTEEKECKLFQLDIDITAVSSSANATFDALASKFSKEIEKVAKEAIPDK